MERGRLILLEAVREAPVYVCIVIGIQSSAVSSEKSFVKSSMLVSGTSFMHTTKGYISLKLSTNVSGLMVEKSCMQIRSLLIVPLQKEHPWRATACNLLY